MDKIQFIKLVKSKNMPPSVSFTPINFATHIITKIFDKTLEETKAITYSVNHHAAANVVFTHMKLLERNLPYTSVCKLVAIFSKGRNGK